MNEESGRIFVESYKRSMSDSPQEVKNLSFTIENTKSIYSRLKYNNIKSLSA